MILIPFKGSGAQPGPFSVPSRPLETAPIRTPIFDHFSTKKVPKMDPFLDQNPAQGGSKKRPIFRPKKATKKGTKMDAKMDQNG